MLFISGVLQTGLCVSVDDANELVSLMGGKSGGGSACYEMESSHFFMER